MTEAWKEIEAMKKQGDEKYGEQPNVVHLNLPRNSQNEGAAWVYLPSKDTIYIGPPGSYHVDIAHSLKTLVDSKHGEKPITGVQYDDGYTDYFDAMDEKTMDRILKALQSYHEENYGSKGFNEAEDDAGAWGHDDRVIYPRDEDYEEPAREKGMSGLDTYNPGGYDPNEDPTPYSYSDHGGFDDRAWGDHSKDDGPIQMKPSPGAPKPIGEWNAQDYLDWRDKKYWGAGGMFVAPREDYPHFRWSYGDSKIMPGCPHEGLWVWPTQNGYPDHFAQTGHKGLGNCAQGRIYPHQGDKWEILTWPQRPRNAPSEATRQYIQEEAQKAVKEYVMEKIGVPEEDIFFTNMHYSAAVMSYNSPSYPDDEDRLGIPPTPYKPRGFHYDWEQLADWNSVPEGTYNALKDPSGRIWLRSSIPPTTPGHMRLYAQDKEEPRSYEVDPQKETTAGWEIGKKVYDDEPSGGTENPYDWHSNVDTVNPNESLKEFYDRIVQDKQQSNPSAQQIKEPVGAQMNPDEYHKNPDGTWSRLSVIQNGPNKGNVLFNWNGSKWSWQQLTPEETYEIKTRWFTEDEATRRDIARKIFPEAYGDVGDELDENGELIPPTTSSMEPGEWKVSHNGLVAFRGPNDSFDTYVTPEEFQLTYRIHGDNWWKSFVPNDQLSENDMWTEVV